MSSMDILFLALVFIAFTSFTVTVAFVSKRRPTGQASTYQRESVRHDNAAHA